MHHVAEPIEAASRRRAWPSSTATSRTRSCGCSPGWSTSASASTASMLRSINVRLTDEVERLGAELRRVVGRDDLNLNSPIQLRALLFDERGLMGVKKTKSGYSTDAATLEKLRDQWPEFIDPLLRHREVEKLRGTYGEGLLARDRRRRSHPRHLQPDRRPHRPPQLRQAEPAQHPGPQRRGPRVPHRVRAGPRSRAARRRLQPDRAALHRPPGPRPRSDRRVHERSGHPQRHRGAGVRRRAEGRHPRPALEGEDGLVRARLRDGGVRPRSAAQHPHRGGDQDPRRLLRGVPERQGVHGRHRHRGAEERATPRRCSGAGGRSPSCSTRTGGSARRASARR